MMEMCRSDLVRPDEGEEGAQAMIIQESLSRAREVIWLFQGLFLSASD